MGAKKPSHELGNSNVSYSAGVPFVAQAMRFALVVMTLLACACGSAHACQGCTAPTSPIVTTPAPGFDVLITEGDRAVTVKEGQRIELVLQEKPGMSGVRDAVRGARHRRLAATAASGARAVRGRQEGP